ncbi:MAG: hypothetical protein GX364_00295 [Firmicutes bacterium]|jgi:stage III sporulation protein AG|nr:hypothetical protein [Bacillota bacterium]
MNIGQRIRAAFFIEGDGMKKKLNRGLLILLVVGIGILLFGSFFKSSHGTGKTSSESRTREAAAVPGPGGVGIEREIANILNKIEGISHAAVFLTMESGPELVLADYREGSERETSEEDSDGGSREISEKNWKDDYVILQEAGGGERPLVILERKEQYRGALVVARGVEDTRLKAQVTEAMSSLLGLPSHRIVVLPHD